MSVYYHDDTITLHLGDALESARALPDGSVRSIVTSPPYYGLRDYGESGQYGGESSVHEYVATMVALFRELRRVLTDDGTLWLNLGDSYARNPAKGFSGTMNGRNVPRMGYNGGAMAAPEVPEKNLLGVPWRVALALQEDGWILRSDIIWHKPNPMPESVTDRPTKAHEYIFLFAKSPRYYYDADAIAEEQITKQGAAYYGTSGKHGYNAASGNHRDKSGSYGNAETRNKRTVWEQATIPFGGAHFAVYPPELIRPCILAGTEPGDVVLDPFSGSGTTGMVATEEGRKYVGFDLNSEYLDLSLRTRFAQPTLGIAT